MATFGRAGSPARHACQPSPRILYPIERAAWSARRYVAQDYAHDDASNTLSRNQAASSYRSFSFLSADSRPSKYVA